MAGEISFQVSYDKIKRSSNVVSFPEEPVSFRDVKLQMCVKRLTSRGDDISISTGIKVTLPEMIKYVKFSLKIIIINGSNRYVMVDQGSDIHGYDDPQMPWAQYGAGPFNMNSSQISSSNLSKFVSADGNLKFKVSIQNRYYQVEYDMSSMMKRMAGFLESKHPDLVLGGEKSDINQLKKQISVLESENSKINQEAETMESELQKRKDAIIEQERQVVSLEKSNLALTEENKKLAQQASEYEAKLEALNSEVASCQFVDALAAMKPEKVRLGECDKKDLQEFQQKLLMIQRIILQTINVKDKCEKCGKNSKECAMMPCKHLAYCLPCYQEIDQARNQKSSDDSAPKPLNCPVCSTEVGQVINVQS